MLLFHKSDSICGCNESTWTEPQVKNSLKGIVAWFRDIKMFQRLFGSIELTLSLLLGVRNVCFLGILAFDHHNKQVRNDGIPFCTHFLQLMTTDQSHCFIRQWVFLAFLEKIHFFSSSTKRCAHGGRVFLRVSKCISADLLPAPLFCKLVCGIHCAFNRGLQVTHDTKPFCSSNKTMDWSWLDWPGSSPPSVRELNALSLSFFLSFLSLSPSLSLSLACQFHPFGDFNQDFCGCSLSELSSGWQTGWRSRNTHQTPGCFSFFHNSSVLGIIDNVRKWQSAVYGTASHCL